MLCGVTLNRVAWALVANLLLGAASYFKKKLTLIASLGAVMIGIIHLVCSPSVFALLLTFYVLGVSATQIGRAYKTRLVANDVDSSQRTLKQVLCNSLPSLFWLMMSYNTGYLPTVSPVRCWAGIVGHFASATGDTLASELGILNLPVTRYFVAPLHFLSRTYHVTQLIMVPPGTNGGITLFGSLGSVLGGAGVGVVAWVASSWLQELETYNISISLCSWLTFGALLGATGSLIDSFLGATIQATDQDITTGKVTLPQSSTKSTRISGVDLLSNSGVNLVANTVTSLLAAFLITPFLSW